MTRHSNSAFICLTCFSALLVKRIASLPGLQEKRTARIFFYFLAQTIDHILEQYLIAVAISAPNRFDEFLQTKT